MKKTARKAAKKTTKPAMTFEDVVNSIPAATPIYYQLGTEPVATEGEWTEPDGDGMSLPEGFSWADPEVDEKPPVVDDKPVVEERPVTVSKVAPEVTPEPKKATVSIDDLAESVERLIKVIRFIYGRAKRKTTYNPDDIAKATRWVDEAERQLAQLRKK